MRSGFPLGDGQKWSASVLNVDDRIDAFAHTEDSRVDILVLHWEPVRVRQGHLLTRHTDPVGGVSGRIDNAQTNTVARPALEYFSIPCGTTIEQMGGYFHVPGVSAEDVLEAPIRMCVRGIERVSGFREDNGPVECSAVSPGAQGDAGDGGVKHPGAELLRDRCSVRGAGIFIL